MALQCLKSKSRLRRFKIFFIFHFLIILDEDASFFLAVQKQDKKDALKKDNKKMRNFLIWEYQHTLKDSKLIKGIV